MARIRGMAEGINRKLCGLKKATESKVLDVFASSHASGGTLLKRGVFLPSAPKTSPLATCTSSPPQADAPKAQRSSRPSGRSYRLTAGE